MIFDFTNLRSIYCYKLQIYKILTSYLPHYHDRSASYTPQPLPYMEDLYFRSRKIYLWRVAGSDSSAYPLQDRIPYLQIDIHIKIRCFTIFQNFSEQVLSISTLVWRSISQFSSKSSSSSPKGFINCSATFNSPMKKKNCRIVKMGTYLSIFNWKICLLSPSMYCRPIRVTAKKLYVARVTTWVYTKGIDTQS